MSSVPSPAFTRIGSDSPAAVDRLNQRAFAGRHEDARTALVLADEALAMASRIGYDAGRAWALQRLALLRHMLGESLVTVEPVLMQGLAVFRELGERAGEAEALNLRGNLLDTAGDPLRAAEQHGLALALRRALGDRAGEAGSLNNLGIALRHQGRHAEALEVLLQSLEIARDLGEPRGAAYPLLNIARTLADLGDPAEASLRCHEVLALAARTDDRGLECSAHVQLGEAQLALGRHEAALAELHRAWQIAERTANAGDLALAMRALGAVHQSLGAFATAAERLHGALALARRQGDPELVCDVLRLLGRNELLQGRPNDALRLLDEALQVALRRGAPLLAAPVHELLAQAHEAAGDLAEALANLREFQRCRDAMQGQATLRRVHALLWRQQVAGLEREAQSQRDLVQSLADALAATRQAEQEKAALLAEVAAQAEVLQQLAREDGLTQIANRRWFDTQWPRELERARRHAHEVAVAMVDVDDFKRVNDRFGHAVGDEVLRRIARALRENCRSNDLVARYGGEEFVLMFVETGLAGARVTCEKLRALVQAIDWGAVHEGLSPVTVSIGLACWTPEGAPRDVLGAADEALYRAKAEGKNRLCTSESSCALRPIPSR